MSDAMTPRLFPSILAASSVGSIAYSRLNADNGEGIVHGVFDSAINMRLVSGLVSLVPETVERGPLNITLPVGPKSMSSLGVRSGDKIDVHDSTLEIGDRCRVVFESARVYSPNRKFSVPILEDIAIAANAEIMRETSLRFGKKSGLGDVLALVRPGEAARTTGSLNIFSAAALPRIVRLERAYHSGERSLVTAAVRNLLGLGPGLTPSSDDMLAGLLLICVLYARNGGSVQLGTRLIAHATVAEAKGRTTLLSEEYLRQAASGRGNEPVMRLCASLLTRDGTCVERETRRVLSIGESSGTDTVLGLFLGTALCMGGLSGLAAEELE